LLVSSDLLCDLSERLRALLVSVVSFDKFRKEFSEVLSRGGVGCRLSPLS
jgi:hypothetical protein